MLRNSENGYGVVAVVLHWTIAALFMGQLALGLVMVRIASQRIAFDLIQWHKSFGLLILALALIRLAWRLANPIPHLPPAIPSAERSAARLSHTILYALQIILPLTGWVLVSVSVLAIPTFAFYLFIVPHLPLVPSEMAEQTMILVHSWLAYGAIPLVALHFAAALRHQFWLKDGLLMRIIRPVTNK